MRTGWQTPRSRYRDSGRATHGLGVRYRGDLPVGAGGAPVSTAPTVYIKSPLFVISCRHRTLPLGLITNARFRGCAVHHPRWRFPALFTNYAQVFTAIYSRDTDGDQRGVLGTERFQREIAATAGRRTWRGSPGRPVRSDGEAGRREVEG
jgi:hypothetical protein